MPLYFFDVHDGVAVRDDRGLDLPSRQEARWQALQCAAAYASNPDNLDATGAIVVTVRDEHDAQVVIVRLACQVEEREAGVMAA